MPARWTLPVALALTQLAHAPLARAQRPSETEVASEPQAPEPAADDPADDADDRSASIRQVHVPRATASLTASGRWIDARTLSTQPHRSVEDFLRLVPGMLIVQHGNQGKGHQFYVRGFDAAHGSDVEMLVGDIPLNEPSNVHAHGYLDLAFIPPEVVAGIDAHKGSYRLEQGNFATAATVQVHLGVPEERRGTRVGYEIGSTNRHRAVMVYAPPSKPESTFLALDAMHDDGYGENRRSQRVNALSQVRLLDRGPAHVDGIAGVYAARFGLPGLVRLHDYNAGRQAFYDAYTDETHGESSRALLGVTAGVDQGKTRASLTAYGMARRLVLDENFTGFLQEPMHGDRHRQVQHAGTLGVRANWRYDVHSRVQLQLHGNWQGNAIEQRQDELLGTGLPHDSSRDLRIGHHTWGAGPGVRVLPVDWLTVDAGLRMDVMHDAVQDHLQDGRVFRGTFWAASPRLAMRARVGASWELVAAYGRGFRSPEARSITLPREPPQNVDLDLFAGGEPRMTLSDAVEVGSRFRPSRVFDVGATLFGNFIARESIFDHVSGFNVERSATRRLGAEADVQIHPVEWMHLGIDATVVRGRFVTTGAPIPGAPSLIVSAFGMIDHRSGWHAGWRGMVLGPRALAYGASAGAVTLLDASVGYRHRRIGLDVNVDNILGTKWREGEYNYASHWDPDQPRSRIPTVHYIAGYPRMFRVTLTLWF